MRQAHLQVSLLWCIHGSFLIDDFQFDRFTPSFEDLLIFPEGMALNDVQEWFIEFEPNIPQDTMDDFCVPMDDSVCTIWTRGTRTRMIRFFGTIQALREACSPYLNWIRFVSPEFDIFLVPDDMQGEEEDFLQLQAATWGLNRVGADQRGRAGAGSTVFILDTGVRCTHQEFGNRASSALDMTVGNPQQCNGDTNCALDRQGHGTHCAGTAAGESYGVAPSASIKAIKVLSDSGSGSWSWSYYALNWLATHQTRPAVASMSLGGWGNQQAMRDAVDEAVNGGVTVVVAGGNSNTDACRFSPAFVPSAITVGSTTSTDTRSSFSNYGSCTNIWAPGSSVLSAGLRSDTASATLSGTSMACPHVSGAAALVLEADPSMKSSAVLIELLNNAVRGAISGLRTGDTNALLYVGED